MKSCLVWCCRRGGWQMVLPISPLPRQIWGKPSSFDVCWEALSSQVWAHDEELLTVLAVHLVQHTQPHHGTGW